MAEPFVFHYTRGVGGRPEAMYIADLECACWMCGQPQLQRFYHAEALHPVDLPRLDALALTLFEKVEYTCEQCGADVGPESARRGVLRWGFGDDAGELLWFVDFVQTADEDLRPGGALPPEPTGRLRALQALPQRRLDPQVQPAFALPEGAEHALDGDTLAPERHDWIEARLGRPVNLKRAIIELVADWRDDPEGGAVERLTPELWISVEATPDRAAATLHAVLAEDAPDTLDGLESGDWLLIPLSESAPRELATHAHPERLPGRWTRWLPEPHDAQSIIAAVALPPLLAHVERAFEVARLSWSYDPDTRTIHTITTPREGVYPHPLHLSAIARRAVHTGISPGEAARLSAEEIVGLLMGVFGDPE